MNGEPDLYIGGQWRHASDGGTRDIINPADGSVRQLLTDSRLRWPDTFSQGPDGAIYLTASHIQDSPWFHMAWTDKNFTLFKFMPKEINAAGSRGEPKRQ